MSQVTHEQAREAVGLFAMLSSTDAMPEPQRAGRDLLRAYIDQQHLQQEQLGREVAELREEWGRLSCGLTRVAIDHADTQIELTKARKDRDSERAQKDAMRMALEEFTEKATELRDVFGQIADAVNENCDDLQPRDLLQLVVALETERDSLRTENKDQLAELRDLRMVFGYTDALLDELTESAISKLTAYAQRLVPKLREMVEAAQRQAAPGCPTQGCIYMGGHNGPCFREGDVVPAVVYVGPSPTDPTEKKSRFIAYRGSVTDLATDVAWELSPRQGEEIVRELERFLSSEPSKFRAASTANVEARPPSCRHVRPPRPSIAEPHCVLPAGHDGDHAAMSVDDVPAGPRWSSVAKTETTPEPRCGCRDHGKVCGTPAEWFYTAGDFWMCAPCFRSYAPSVRTTCRHIATMARSELAQAQDSTPPAGVPVAPSDSGAEKPREAEGIADQATDNPAGERGDSLHAEARGHLMHALAEMQKHSNHYGAASPFQAMRELHMAVESLTDLMEKYAQ
jgi:hypothetical protein